MKHLHLVVGVLLVALGPATAQHCAPLYQSFLSEISVKWVRDDSSIRIRAEYTKDGGSGCKDAYQADVVAYLSRDAKKVPTPKGQDVLDAKATVVLHTQLIRRNAENTYDLDYTIHEKDLVARVIKHNGLGEEDRTELNSWHVYKDRIRLAVFIPFLDDEKYSTLDGLPEDRHECNYTYERALLFQTLPYQLDFRVGVGDEIEGGVSVPINGDKPPLD